MDNSNTGKNFGGMSRRMGNFRRRLQLAPLRAALGAVVVVVLVGLAGHQAQAKQANNWSAEANPPVIIAGHASLIEVKGPKGWIITGTDDPGGITVKDNDAGVTVEPGGAPGLYVFTAAPAGDANGEKTYTVTIRVKVENKDDKKKTKVQTVKTEVTVIHLKKDYRPTFTLVPEKPEANHTDMVKFEIKLANGKSLEVTKFDWKAKSYTGRLTLAPIVGNSNNLTFSGSFVNDKHADESLGLGVFINITEIQIKDRKEPKKVKWGAYLPGEVTVVHSAKKEEPKKRPIQMPIEPVPEPTPLIIELEPLPTAFSGYEPQSSPRLVSSPEPAPASQPVPEPTPLIIELKPLPPAFSGPQSSPREEPPAIAPQPAPTPAPTAIPDPTEDSVPMPGR